jgi:hypothetical protein
MKFFISLILIAFLSFAACLYLPWWSIAVVAFLVVLFIPQSPGRAFLCGFLALAILWGGLSFWISNNNEHILAHRVSQLVLQADNPYLLIVVTALIGGLVAGLAALTASFVGRRKAVA